MKTKKNQKKGISLVISLIMMTLLLSISFSIGNIVLRQIRLTNTSTNSQIAFYAADSALECAIYLDTHTDGTVPGVYGYSGANAIFGTSTSWVPGTSPIDCGSIDAYGDPMGYTRVVSADQSIATTTFFAAFSASTCARVEVVKTPFRTKISANGYNVGPNDARDGCDTSNAAARRIVERGLVFSH